MTDPNANSPLDNPAHHTLHTTHNATDTLVNTLAALNFLVGTASGSLSGEIAVGTTPGGELGGTWGSPTVDATHSGSAHHAQAHTAGSHSDVPAAGAYTQTYATADKTHAAFTSADVVTTGSGLASYGYTQAQADSIPVAINAIRVDLADIKQLVNAVIDDLQTLGVLQ